MESWDIYDKHRCPLGKIKERGTRLEDGEYHLTAHICIFDREGRMLIQQRADCKSTWPSLWDVTAAGSVLAGESSEQGAHRELFEELGLDRDFTNIRPHFTLNYDGGFGDYYLLVEDEVNLSELCLQKSEVKAVKYATLAEIEELLSKEQFIPYHHSFVSLLFDIKEECTSYIKDLAEKLKSKNI